jgi:hypothetical protein
MQLEDGLDPTKFQRWGSSCDSYINIWGSSKVYVQLKYKYYKMEEDKFLLCNKKVYVPNYQELRNLVSKVMHNVSYDGHTGYHKTISTIRG